MICLTHDVDGPFERRYVALFTEIARRPMDLSPSEAVGSFRMLLQGRLNWFFLPKLLEIERRFDVKSTFFFRVDQETYAIGDLKPVIRDLDSQCFEIGLHASIRSAFVSRLLKEEKALLESVLGHPVKGVRHHYLTLGRNTWEFHKSAGFEYDSSLGYRNDVNFMQPFALPSGMRVFPMSLMDLSGFLLYRPSSRCFHYIDKILDRVKDEDLIFTVLFHGDHFGFKQERLLYVHLLQRARELGIETVPLAVANERCR
jgi:peptidoglycan/xylan/chitin deacetylase (PgdA/CDA1 family)